MKSYIECIVSEDPSIFSGYYKNYSVEQIILERLAKDLGFSYDMYTVLNALDQSTADKLVYSMSKKNNREKIILLVDDDLMTVLGYTLESRAPILNDDFIKRVSSLVETSNEVSIVDRYYTKDDVVSSVIIKKSNPIVIDTNIRKDEYYIGVLVVNSEVETTYCRLVIFLNDQPIYLPASYYNVTTNRYKKSTGSSVEALEVLLLKIIDELREEELKYKISDFHTKYRANKEVLVTYEEYNALIRTMMRIPSVIDDRSLLESLNSKYDDFEKKYSHLDDQKSSYIWRCTALGEMTIGALTNLTSNILNEIGAPSIEYFSIRELIGSYLSTNRIAVEIAKEDIR